MISEEIATYFKSKPILVTGGLGFIGSNLAHQLVALGARVTLLDSLIPEYGGNMFNIAGIEDLVRVNISDVRDEHSMRYLIQKQEYLFNLAGQTSHMDSMKNPLPDLEINARAQLFILEACRKYNPSIKIVFASTRQIYGKPTYLPVDENHPVQPIDVNGINKMAGEWYHLVYSKVYGIRSIVLRLTNTYGPRMRVKDARQTFLGIWIRRLIEGKPILIFGDGTQKRDFNYVDDVVDALLKSAISDNANGEIFNLGTEDPVSLKETAELLIEANGGAGSYQFVPFPTELKAIDIGDYYGDYRKINKCMDWRPITSLKSGLQKTIDFYHQYHTQYWDPENGN